MYRYHVLAGAVEGASRAEGSGKNGLDLGSARTRARAMSTAERQRPSLAQAADRRLNRRRAATRTFAERGRLDTNAGRALRLSSTSLGAGLHSGVAGRKAALSSAPTTRVSATKYAQVIRRKNSPKMAPYGLEPPM